MQLPGEEISTSSLFFSPSLGFSHPSAAFESTSSFPARRGRCTSHEQNEAGHGVEELKGLPQLCRTNLRLSVTSFAGSGLSWMPRACVSFLIKTTQAVRKIFIRAFGLVQKRRSPVTGALEFGQSLKP